MDIRKFRDGDEAALYRVFYSSVHGIASGDYDAAQREAWAPPDMDFEAWTSRVQKNRPFVAVLDGEIVAFADVQANGYIDQFFVSARCARSGIGTGMMRHLLETARALGLAEINADVSRTAEPFFLRFGFEVVERRSPVRQGIVLPNALMRKKLPVGPSSATVCPSS